MVAGQCQDDEHPGGDPPPCPARAPTSRLGSPPPPGHPAELAVSERHNRAREIGFYHQRISACRISSNFKHLL